MKRDHALLALLIVMMISASNSMPDSRLTEGLEKSEAVISERIVREIASVTEEVKAETKEESPEEVKEDASEEVVIEEAQEEELEEYSEEEYIEESEEVIEEEAKAYTEPLEYLGTYEVTAYEYTGSPCANGNYPSEGYTVACNSLPLGTVVYIDGVGYRTVEDRGASWHGDNWMDLYLGDVSTCYEWGRQYRDVYIVR